MSYHRPVLLRECMEGLNVKPDGIYVDVTFGGGGHAREILKLLTTGKLVAFDQDPDAKQNEIKDDRFMLLPHNFRFMHKYLRYYNLLPVDGVLADLGVSSYQIDTPERGFSSRFDAPLDMRMDTRTPRTAGELLNTSSEKELAGIFYQYGELANARKIAAAIVTFRKQHPLHTTTDLKKAVAHCVPGGHENQFYAKLFQALRIEVNGELDALKEFLLQSLDVLKPGGRLAVISYHSLEDRLVKKFIAKGRFEGEPEKDFYGNTPALPFRVVTKKPVLASAEEVKENPRSRSAKLRVAERCL